MRLFVRFLALTFISFAVASVAEPVWAQSPPNRPLAQSATLPSSLAPRNPCAVSNSPKELAHRQAQAAQCRLALAELRRDPSNPARQALCDRLARTLTGHACTVPSAATSGAKSGNPNRILDQNER